MALPSTTRLDRAQLDAMLDLALAGIQQLVAAQRKAVDVTTRKLVFATRNKGKLVELRELLATASK